MLLYHYSKTPLKELTTKHYRGEVTDEDKKEAQDNMKYRCAPAPYYDHISFFFDPVPLDIMGTIFADYHHDFWIPGTTIYQHVIESRYIGNFLFFIVETPEDLEQMNKEWPIGVELSDLEARAYHQRAAARREKVGHIGHNNKDFEKAAEPFIGGTRAAYETAATLHDEYTSQQYAAYVPHVMLYPESGIIHLKENPKAVKIGKAKVSKEEHGLFIPGTAKW